jgi:hypothetical protein
MELGTVATEVTPSEVIDEEEYEVRKLFRGQGRHGKKSKDNE